MRKFLLKRAVKTAHQSGNFECAPINAKNDNDALSKGRRFLRKSIFRKSIFAQDAVSAARAIKQGGNRMMKKTVDIVGVQMDLGAATRGVAMGPMAIRYGGICEGLKTLGYEVCDKGDIIQLPQGAS